MTTAGFNTKSAHNTLVMGSIKEPSINSSVSMGQNLWNNIKSFSSAQSSFGKLGAPATTPLARFDTTR